MTPNIPRSSRDLYIYIYIYKESEKGKLSLVPERVLPSPLSFCSLCQSPRPLFFQFLTIHFLTVFICTPRDRHKHFQISSCQTFHCSLPPCSSKQQHAIPVPHNDLSRGRFDTQIHTVLPHARQLSEWTSCSSPFPQCTCHLGTNLPNFCFCGCKRDNHHRAQRHERGSQVGKHVVDAVFPCSNPSLTNFHAQSSSHPVAAQIYVTLVAARPIRLSSRLDLFFRSSLGRSVLKFLHSPLRRLRFRCSSQLSLNPFMAIYRVRLFCRSFEHGRAPRESCRKSERLQVFTRKNTLLSTREHALLSPAFPCNPCPSTAVFLWTVPVSHTPLRSPTMTCPVVASIPRCTPSSHMHANFPSGPPARLRFHWLPPTTDTRSTFAGFPFSLSHAVIFARLASNLVNKNPACSAIHGHMECVT